MLSKAKGQILRIVASLQVLFQLNGEQHLVPCTTSTIHISEDAIIAAIDYVEVYCQQTAYMAGRGTISDEIAAYVIGALCKFKCVCRCI